MTRAWEDTKTQPIKYVTTKTWSRTVNNHQHSSAGPVWQHQVDLWWCQFAWWRCWADWHHVGTQQSVLQCWVVVSQLGVGAAFLLVTAMVMSAGVLAMASGCGGLSGSRLMDGWLLSLSGALWLPDACLTPKRSTSNTTLSMQGRLVWGDSRQTDRHKQLWTNTLGLPVLSVLTMMPRALRMLSLHIGQVQCSFSQGSTHTLWKTCLQRHRDISDRTHPDASTLWGLNQPLTVWISASDTGLTGDTGRSLTQPSGRSLARQDANHIIQLVRFNTHGTVVKVRIGFLQDTDTKVQDQDNWLRLAGLRSTDFKITDLRLTSQEMNWSGLHELMSSGSRSWQNRKYRIQ